MIEEGYSFDSCEGKNRAEQEEEFENDNFEEEV